MGSSWQQESQWSIPEKWGIPAFRGRCWWSRSWVYFLREILNRQCRSVVSTIFFLRSKSSLLYVHQFSCLFVWEHYWDIHAWTARDASWAFFLLWKVWYLALMYVVVSIFPELNVYSFDGHRGYTRVSKSADQGHQLWHLLYSYILWWYSIVRDQP